MLVSAILADYHFLGGASLSADTEKGEFLMSNRYRLAALAAVVAMLAVPSAVTASHTFVDVSDSNVHHDDITWLQNAGVTRGCNPPANTEFCPDEPVLRQEMASFMRRLAEKRVVDAATVAGLTPGEIAHGYARKGATEAGSLNGVRKLEEIRITVPADGYLQLSGAASFRDDDGGSMLVWLQLDKTTCEASPEDAARIGFGYASTAGNDDNSIVDTASAQGMVAVTRGTHTVTLCGYNTQGPASVFGPNIVAVFLKNAAVSADLQSEDPLELPLSD